MALKDITTVDEISAADPANDSVLVVRGNQADLRRLMVEDLPSAFDLHDKVTTELATLAGADRFLVSDESASGQPNKYVTLQTLRDAVQEVFDLHDDVPTELTSLADADRLLISDESVSGDPNRYARIDTLRAALRRVLDLHDDVPTELTSLSGSDRMLVSDESASGDPNRYSQLSVLATYVAGQLTSFAKRESIDVSLSNLPTTRSSSQNYTYDVTVSHSLGRVPKVLLVAGAQCISNDSPFSVGDRLSPVKLIENDYLSNRIGLGLKSGTSSQAVIRFNFDGVTGWELVFMSQRDSGVPLRAEKSIVYSNRTSWKLLCELIG